jgi:hypothetical protein
MKSPFNHHELTIQSQSLRLSSSLTSNTLHGELQLPSGKLTQLWKYTTLIGKSTINGPFSAFNSYVSVRGKQHHISAINPIHSHINMEKYS